MTSQEYGPVRSFARGERVRVEVNGDCTSEEGDMVTLSSLERSGVQCTAETETGVLTEVGREAEQVRV